MNKIYIEPFQDNPEMQLVLCLCCSLFGLCLAFVWSLFGVCLAISWPLDGLWMAFGCSLDGLWMTFGWFWMTFGWPLVGFGLLLPLRLPKVNDRSQNLYISIKRNLLVGKGLKNQS